MIEHEYTDPWVGVGNGGQRAQHHIRISLALELELAGRSAAEDLGQHV